MYIKYTKYSYKNDFYNIHEMTKNYTDGNQASGCQR